MRYAIKIAYDGTNYGGWQIQKNNNSVQEEIERVAKTIFGKRVAVIASGRTDSGVHAAAQICHFDADTSIPPDKIADAFNAYLPTDISVLQSACAPENFDATRSAKRKTYCYKMYLSPRRNPLKDRYSEWIKIPVNIAKLKHITGCFEGIHDFKAYCKSNSSIKTTVREIYSVDVKTTEDGISTDVEIYVCGNGFLYNMVRTIAGTMLGFAAGSISEEEVKNSIENCDRGCVGKTMPAHGLTLESVDYGVDLFG
ncbi:MAG: tRNA pseudouridine(38-40) synthase TruA [Clostridiales bacterium]|nr:tRNA pseudouridine(38-40) synthase TruA [Clostridiales bacterium]